MHIRGNGVTNTELRLNDPASSGNTTSGIRFQRNGTDYAYVSGGAFSITGGSITDLALTVTSGNNILFGIANAEKMRIDTVGRVMIATSTRGQSSSDDLTIGDGSTDTGITIRSSSSTTGNLFFSRSTGQDAASYAGYIQYQHSANRMYFGTGSIAKALIGQYGYFHASADGQFHGDLAAGDSHHSFDTDLGQWVMQLRNRNSTTAFGLLLKYSAFSSSSTTGNQFIYCEDSSQKRFGVRATGIVESYGSVTLSDEREKKNISDLDAKWDTVKSWNLKKFHFNEDADSDNLRYGVIAQQVESISPEVIDDWEKQKAAEAELDENGNVETPAKEQILRKSVKSEQMMWMAIKALQEAQARIETLETANADLVARVTALEG